MLKGYQCRGDQSKIVHRNEKFIFGASSFAKPIFRRFQSIWSTLGSISNETILNSQDPGYEASLFYVILQMFASHGFV